MKNIPFAVQLLVENGVKDGVVERKCLIDLPQRRPGDFAEIIEVGSAPENNI